MALERVQKILAQAGISSRRKAEELIAEGAVTINGKAAKLGDKADLGKDSIKVRGKLLHGKEEPVYLAFYKPRGVLSTLSDPENRPTLRAYLGRVKARVFPIGRLDFNSEGLILLTNDGAFAERVQKATHLLRVYAVKVKGRPDASQISRLERGARMGTKVIQPHSVRMAEELPSKVVLEVAFNDSGAIDVKQLFESKGLLVDKITRTAIGHLTLRGIMPGNYRVLQASQVEALLTQPELGLRKLEAAENGVEKNAEGGYEYRKPSRSKELKERRREVQIRSANSVESEAEEGSSSSPRITPRTPGEPKIHLAATETESTRRPRRIIVRPRGSESTSSFSKKTKTKIGGFSKPRPSQGSRERALRDPSFDRKSSTRGSERGSERSHAFEKNSDRHFGDSAHSRAAFGKSSRTPRPGVFRGEQERSSRVWSPGVKPRSHSNERSRPARGPHEGRESARETGIRRDDRQNSHSGRRLGLTPSGDADRKSFQNSFSKPRRGPKPPIPRR